MTKVKLLTTLSHGDDEGQTTDYKKGTEIDLDRKKADHYVAIGVAEYTDPSDQPSEGEFDEENEQ